MPVITNAGGGSGAGSDECTLLRANVPKGLKAVTADSGDEALEGTLEAEGTAADSHVLDGQTYLKYDPGTKLFNKRAGSRKNNGALNAELNCGESYTIPAGDTTGGKVTAKSLASQTQGNAHSGVILPGYNAWINGVNTPGNMATQAGRYINPTTYNQVVCGAGRYVAGDQGVYGDANLRAENIRKNVPIFGVMGSWQGYVDSPLYLFNNGTWSNLQTPGMANATQSGGNLRVPTDGGYLYQTVDLTNYKYLKLSARSETESNRGYGFAIEVTKTPAGAYSASADIRSSTSTYITGILDISSLSGFYYIKASNFRYFLNGATVFNGDYLINQIFLTTT